MLNVIKNNIFELIESIPSYIFLFLIASTAIIIGIEWDISWHETIGRDKLLSPPHVVVYIGGIICGLTCAYMALRQTFVDENLYNRYVVFWGFKAPFACWVCIWGAIAMLTSAPFDDWWHNAYGLDVQIISPPHLVLAAGIFANLMGSLFLLIAEKNLAKGKQKHFLEILYMYAASLIVVQFAILLTEYSFHNKQHTYEFYKFSLIIYSFLIIAFRVVGTHKYSATIISILYILHRCLIIWILPLFKAEPLLGPIYRDIDHYVAPYFPVLLVAPAIAIDVIHNKFRNINNFYKAIMMGVSFCIIFLLVQWHFSEFLLSEYARNWFFAGDNTFPYWVRVNENNYKFWFLDWTPYGQRTEMERVTFVNFGFLIIFTIIFSYLGTLFGSWIKKVKR
ncbi:MAG: hypothetical protein VYD20_03145 [Candidatus Neomarinimicrobiota bacterium]|nr:hypothetical protein [Candidatus Neomarinimicrobiota bacterium]